jgi:hypothetical protein
MSFQAINEATKALATLIESQVKQVIPVANVTLLPPGDTLPEETGVNLYLYRIIECSFMRNQPWRGDRERPPSDKPPLALQLHYLLTPLGKTSDATAQAGDVAHTLLGISMLTLHEHPILNDTHIAGFDADLVLSDHLRNSFEDVKVTLSSVSVEDLSKIWATINKPYRLSVAYEVSLVELVPDRAPPVQGGIVQRTGVDVFTLSPPYIEALAPANGALARLVGNVITANTLTITGSGLGRPTQQPTVRIGDLVAELTVPAAPPFASLTVRLPTNLNAGPGVDVRVETFGKASQPAQFVVEPWLASITPVRTALEGTNPRLVLTGQGLTATPQVRFSGPAGIRTEPAATVGGELSVAIPTDLTNGLYDVRVRLPGNLLSNGRTLAVMPRIDPLPMVSVVNGKHRIDLAGARLAGTQIVVIVDGVAYEAPVNSSDQSLSFTFQRRLSVGEHQVAVDVEGNRSQTMPFTVT